MNNPPSRDSDLTAKARIRNTALDFFGRHGEDRVSMRSVASAAGCTVGLVQHHFGSKEGLRSAVEEEIVGHFVATLRGGPGDDDSRDARDARVHAMLSERPEVTGYLRRALLDRPGESSALLSRLVALSLAEVRGLRESGAVTQTRSENVQVTRMLVRQLGVLFLDPLVEAIWDELDQPDQTRPQLRVSLAESAEPGLQARAPAMTSGPDRPSRVDPSTSCTEPFGGD